MVGGGGKIILIYNQDIFALITHWVRVKYSK